MHLGPSRCTDTPPRCRYLAIIHNMRANAHSKAINCMDNLHGRYCNLHRSNYTSQPSGPHPIYPEECTYDVVRGRGACGGGLPRHRKGTKAEAILLHRQGLT
jgi:hypothetical protein